MDIIIRQLKAEPYSSAIFDEYFKGKSFCTFDIETLGLDPRRAPMILAGFMCVRPDGTAEFRQYFLDEPEEEHLLLDEVINELNSYDLIVTFNGRRFDIPYVEKRYSMINHTLPEIRPFDLDLYLVVRGHSGLRGVLPSLSQKSLEEYMGIGLGREDLISGGESVELYYKYLTETDPEEKARIKEIILLHNSDDVEQLYRLLPIMRQCDLHCASFKLGFPVYPLKDSESMILKISRICFTKSGMAVEGTYTGEPFIYKGFASIERCYEMEFHKDRTFRFTVPILREANAKYINLLDFFDDTGDFEDLSGFVNNYLILCEGKELNYREINRFASVLLRDFMGR